MTWENTVSGFSTFTRCEADTYRQAYKAKISQSFGHCS
jgi:hypothetical protein